MADTYSPIEHHIEHPTVRPSSPPQWLRVTVYTKAGCRPCVATKRRLAALGVKYRELPAHLLPADIPATCAPVVTVQDYLHSDLATWCGHQPQLIDQLVGELERLAGNNGKAA